jgi:hypothetical protein
LPVAAELVRAHREVWQLAIGVAPALDDSSPAKLTGVLSRLQCPGHPIDLEGPKPRVVLALIDAQRQVAAAGNDLVDWMKLERAILSRHREVAKAMDYLLKRIDVFTRLPNRAELSSVLSRCCPEVAPGHLGR